MSRPTYVPVPDTDLAIDDYGKTDDVFKQIRDNCASARVQLISMDEAEQSTASTSYVVLWSFPLFIPSAAADPLVTAEITAWIEAKVSANNGDFRLVDNASATAGSPINTSSTSYVELEPVLAIDDAWRGTKRLIDLEARIITSGTAFAKAEASMASRFDH